MSGRKRGRNEVTFSSPLPCLTVLSSSSSNQAACITFLLCQAGEVRPCKGKVTHPGVQASQQQEVRGGDRWG